MIDRVGMIEHPTLEAYLTERHIPIDLARLYLEQVEYRLDQYRFCALASKNDV